MSRATVEAMKCPHCEDAIEDLGGAVYECSRCGATQIEERRCEQCHIFMAKLADQSCPECEEAIDEELPTFTLYVADDGTYHESDAEAATWEAGADERAAQKVRADAETKVIMDRINAQEAIKAAAIVAALEEVLPYLDNDELRESLEWPLKSAREGHPGATWMVPNAALLAEIVPDFPCPELPNDLDDGWRERSAVERAWKNEALDKLHERFPEWLVATEREELWMLRDSSAYSVATVPGAVALLAYKKSQLSAEEA